MEFVFALGGVQLGYDSLHFVIANVDHRFDLASQHAVPGEFALDLAFDRGRR